MNELSTLAPDCPACGKAMGYQEDIKSWRCHACNPEGENIPNCHTQNCKRPLTRLGPPWNCWICLKCNEHPATVNKIQAEKEKQKAEKRKRVDGTYLTDEDVKDIVRKEMAGIGDIVRAAIAESQPAYPPTQADVRYMTAPENLNAKPETWLQKAKRLGVKTHYPDGGGMRKKADVLLDIKRKEQDETSQQSADQGPSGENAESPGGEPARDG